MDEVKQRIQKLNEIIEAHQKEINELKQRRVTQSSVTPLAIKNNHMGQANSYIYAGLAADLPDVGNQVTVSTSVFFEIDTGVLKIWNGTAWLSVTLA